MAAFDLTTKPWVPVMIRGERARRGLRDALVEAHQIDGLALDEPLSTVAILRQVLLPVVIRATGLPRSPAEWSSRWDAGRLDAAAVDAYLDQWADRWDLFDDTAPFAQAAGLRTASGETKSVAVLIGSLASGNNVPLFSTRTDDDPPALAPADAIGRLLAAHAYDTAAIKSGAEGDPQARAGKTTGNPTGPLGQLGLVVPWGRTLFETLLLNLIIIPAGLEPGDAPHWEREPAGPMWSTRPAAGLLDQLTLQSRRIRLIPEEVDGSTVVRRVVLTAGDRLTSLPPELEPHTAWRRVPNPRAGQPAVRPVRHQPGRQAWRGLQPLLSTAVNTDQEFTAPLLLQQHADRLPAGYPLQVVTVGVAYGNQSAVVEDVMTDTLPLPVTALNADHEIHAFLLEVADQAEGLRRAADRLVDDLREAGGGQRLPWDKGQHAGEALMQALTPDARHLLSQLERIHEVSEDLEAWWRGRARLRALEAVGPYLDAVPTTAFLGREQKTSRGLAAGKRTASKQYVTSAATAELRFRAALTNLLGPLESAMPTTGGRA